MQNHHKKASLLKLPPELRNQIYRYVLTGEQRISLRGPAMSQQPGILRASKQLRTEISRIYYLENKFLLTIKDCKLVSQPQHWIFSLPDGSESVTHYEGRASWINLKDWLRKSYDGPSTPDIGKLINDRSGGLMIYGEAFKIVNELVYHGTPWSGVEAVLGPFKKAVEARRGRFRWT